MTLLSEEQILGLAEKLVDAAVWAVHGEPNAFSSWEADEKDLKEMRVLLRDSCIDIIQSAKLEPLRELAKDVYQYLLKAEQGNLKSRTLGEVSVGARVGTNFELPPC